MTEFDTLLLCLLGLQIKHFLADFCFQTPYMLRNKGRYGHPGGLMHAGVHGLLTLPVLALLAPVGAGVLGLVLAEMVVHYHVDWTKEQLSSGAAPGGDSPRFWMIVGADQLAHQGTLLALVWVAYS